MLISDLGYQCDYFLSFLSLFFGGGGGGGGGGGVFTLFLFLFFLFVSLF